MPSPPPARLLKKASSPAVVVFINAIAALDKVKLDSEDENIGVNIVRKALEVPMRKIAENAGKDGSVIIENVRRLAKEQNNKNMATMLSPANMVTCSRPA